MVKLEKLESEQVFLSYITGTRQSGKEFNLGELILMVLVGCAGGGGGGGVGSINYFQEKFARIFIVFYSYSIIKHILGLHNI